jgi:hypothetical protein
MNDMVPRTSLTFLGALSPTSDGRPVSLGVASSGLGDVLDVFGGSWVAVSAAGVKVAGWNL